MDTKNEQVCDNSNTLAQRTVSRGSRWYAHLTGNKFCLCQKYYKKKKCYRISWYNSIYNA